MPKQHDRVELQLADVHNPADFAPAFSFIQANRSEAIVLHSRLQRSARKPNMSGDEKLPTTGQSREMAEAGCLFSYGIKLTDAYVLAARLTDKILRGARPADTPAEQPYKFELVINLKTAKTLGLTVPQPVMGQADEVIE